MADQVWGTGYGSKRHIPDDKGIVEREAWRGTRRHAVAACSTLVFIDTFTDEPKNAAAVMKKTPCTRCAKKAGVQVCPTCSGAGVVGA